jgi:formylglycine-generating enzyme required for sulfatase activity
MANVGNRRDEPLGVDFPGNQDQTDQGIYHLAGNVREWCRDAWGVYSPKDQVDPVRKPAEGRSYTAYVIRGGSYATETETARTTWRSAEGTSGHKYKLHDDEKAGDLGFRVVLEILTVPPDLREQSPGLDHLPGGPWSPRLPARSGRRPS